MGVHWVDTDEALRSWCTRLSTVDRIAVDTESNSMFAYSERICLVQLSIEGADILVDPLAVDLRALGPVLADPKVLKVLHGADYDVLSLKRSLGLRIENLFDTMLAARVLGWERCGLAALLEQHFGHAANKAFQRYDWGLRPLGDDALDYARYDTHFLLPLAALQSNALRNPLQRELFHRACIRQCAVEPRPRPFDPDGYWKFRGARELDEPGRAVLRALYAWREHRAQALDRPPFRVLPEVAMVGLARARPRTPDSLGRVKGLPKTVLRRDAHALLELIAGAAVEPCPRPARQRSPHERLVDQRLEALKGWRKVEAARHQVDPELILDKSSLVAVAQHGDVAALPAWEKERYGTGIRSALERIS